MLNYIVTLKSELEVS